LVIYLAAVFIGGSLLAPWLWWLVHGIAPASSALVRVPFHRYVDRSLLLIALAGLWPLLRALGAVSCREIGLGPSAGQGKRLGGGLLLGFGSLAVLAALTLAAHQRVWRPDMPVGKITGILLGALGTAALVATLEEILFRGGIFGGLRRVLPWKLALLMSSAIYALVHFLQPAELTGPVSWNSGLLLLPLKLAGFVDGHRLVPGFFSLTLVGVMLGLAYQRTGNLYFSIGLHAGWIFWLKSYGAFTVAAAPAVSWFWGTDKLIDGWLAFLVLSAVLAGFLMWPSEKPRCPELRP
jgi:membrane protease YdiL (CAAX protease family)